MNAPAGELDREIEALRERLAEAEEMRRAISQGEVDGFVVGPSDEDKKVLLLAGAYSRYRQLIDEMEHGTVTVDMTGAILFANQRFAQIVGAGLGELHHAELTEYVHHDDRAAVAALLTTPRDDQDGIVVRVLRPTGSLVPARLSLASTWESYATLVLADLSQEDMENRTSVYVEPPRAQARAISHLALRTLHADEVAEFYAELFGFERLARKSGDPNHYLSDGRVTLVLMPWSILDFEGGGIARPGPDHIGFRVESLQAVKERLQTVGDDNPHLRPFPVGTGSEGRARMQLFERCPYGAHHLADPDGVLLDLAEK